MAKAPTLVIHGTVDPLVRPEGGMDTAASIPGAKLLMIEGMGHALPIPMWPQIIDAIDKDAHGAAAKAAEEARSRDGAIRWWRPTSCSPNRSRKSTPGLWSRSLSSFTRATAPTGRRKQR